MQRLLLLLPLVALAVAQSCTSSAPCVGTVYIDASFNLTFKAVLDPLGVAYGIYLEEVELDGWGKLNITSNSSYPNHIQSQAAGYLEGVLTQQRIYQNFVNQQYDWPAEVIQSLDANWAWMQRKLTDNYNPFYWKHVEYMMYQLTGLAQGYASIAPSNQALTQQDLLILNSDGDLGDIETALTTKNVTMRHKQRAASDPNVQDGCSGLVRVTSHDLYVAQTTWDEYQQALRILKAYDLKFTNCGTAAETIVFSSYPGQIAVIETTSSVFDTSLWHFYTNESVFTWINTMVSNRMAVSAFNWTNIFALYSSGTYTNQWLIVDFELYKAGSKLQPQTIMVLEAIPGYTMSQDMTPVLASQGYVASYNIWYIPFIYTATGYPQMAQEYGNWFTYNQSPRALIFARNATSVERLHHMQDLMTYNNFQQDPLSQGYAENGIAARSDLMPNVSVPFSALGPRCHGSIDSKVTSAKLMPQLQMMAYGAPTHVQQSVFNWSNATVCTALGVSHIGLPASYPFDWIDFGPQTFTSALKPMQ